MRASAWFNAPSVAAPVPTVKVLSTLWAEYLARQEAVLVAVMPTATSMGWTDSHPTMVAAREIVTGLLAAIRDARAAGDPLIYRRELLAVRDAGKAALLKLDKGDHEIEGAALSVAARLALDEPVVDSKPKTRERRTFTSAATHVEDQRELTL